MYLRPLEEKDADQIIEWMNDPEFCRFFMFSKNSKKKAEVLAMIRLSRNDASTCHMAIVGDDGEYLGSISLLEINRTNLHAEFAIALQRRYIGKGIAAEAAQCMLNKAFSEFGLHKVYLKVFSDNTRAIRFFENIGFILEGVFKEHILSDGIWRDLKWYAYFRKDNIDANED